MLKQGFISNHFLSPPPPDPPTRPPTTTLFEMMSSEEPTPQNQQKPFDPSRARAEERVKRVLSRAPFMSPGCGDVKLTCTARDGFSVSVNVHRDVLVSKSRFFQEKLGGVRKSWCVEICECDDVEVYFECLVLMYSQDGQDFRNNIVGEGVDKILGLLKVCDALKFDDGISSCLKYLEAVPWSEVEEERVIMNLNELHLPNDHDVLERVALEASTSSRIDDIFLRLFTGVLQAKDEKARREMKSLISRLLREDNSTADYNGAYNKLELSKETLYTICHRCVTSLILCLSQATSGDENRGMMSEITREADNLEWVVDILIEKRICEDFVKLWSDQNELAMLHLRVPIMYRHKISRITAQLCIAIGRGNALVPKETRVALLSTWLEALYDDFGWMKRGSRMGDRRLIEDGLCQIILTLPLSQQQTFLMSWFDRFLEKGDDCPNIQRAFEIWWRRAFVRQPVVEPQLQITVCDYPN
nr:hypothetical protein [Tanacetum cinerariifolium]